MFNSLAKKIFTQETHSNRAEYFIGLGRSIFHLIDKELIAHAVEEIEEHLNNGRQSVASYFFTPIYTGRLISIETTPVLDQSNLMTGFIFTFQDMSDDIDRYENINQTLLSFKQMLGNNMLQEGPLISDPVKQTDKELSRDFKLINEKYLHMSSFILDSTLNKLPLTTLSLSYFLSSLQKRLWDENGINLNLLNNDTDTRILADTYSFTMALVFLLVNLSELTSQNQFALKISTQKNEIWFTIKWQGNTASQIQIESMITKKIRALPSFGYVLRQNRAEFEIIADNNQTCSQVRIKAKSPLKYSSARENRPAVMAASRPEFYDFDLFDIKDANFDLLDTSLKNITYTVFDTETTGLNTDGGDEIIAIAAVRIVNNRIVYQDIFEELVDPKRDIPMESYKIHGINYEMVAGKKDINTILPVFKKFTSDTVFVGHNIAFDMK
ncbi:MAG: hypothetical protein KAJ25_11895, partial [Desulfobacula sp.]|nr:hypothetical protein [Desulfobacula sp.]